MGVIKRIQNDCRHATYLIEKQQHTALSLKERLQLIIHLTGCSICRLFRRQSKAINRMLHSLFHTAQRQDNKLTDEFKQRLQQQIDERLK